MDKVLVGMSGGTDSAVCAYLLKKQGYDVSAVTMTVWKPDSKYRGNSDKNSCFSPDKTKDIEKSKEICEKLGIEHRVIDISDMYEAVVLENFRNEYLNGRTPNPCVWCNQKIKFGAMIDAVRKSGVEFDCFATGHYARIVKQNGRYAIKQAEDKQKDQSYFLYRLSQKQLANTMFPLGEYTKDEIRKTDLELGFHDEAQTESQDFYSGHYTDLLNTEPKTGNIVNTDGKVLGTHDGFWNFTIGQRKGLKIAADKPLYVVGLNPASNEVVVGYENGTFNTGVTASNIVWSAVENLDGEVKAEAKIRSTGVPVPCTCKIDMYDRLSVRFDSAVKAATCGQSLVLYKDGVILCGGIIDSVQTNGGIL